jgi:parallel beta-helix repeat protein
VLKVLLRQKVLAGALVSLLCVTGIVPSIAQADQPFSRPELGGDWWYVGGSGPANFTTIQDAVNQASNGDTVFVYNGTYPGYVILNKTIDLRGQDKHSTAILGYFAFTLDVIADGTTISGFTIELSGRGEGIRIDSNTNNFINNIIDMPGDRLRVAGAGNNVSDNSITGCYLYLSGDENTVSGNSISNEDYGIYLSDCHDNLIVNNALVGCGLYLSSGFISNNTLINNTVNSRPLIYLDNASDLVIDGDAGQVVLVNCMGITVLDQNLSQTTVGLQLWNSDSCILSRNTIMGNDFGICLDGSNNMIDGCLLAENEKGIVLTDARNNISKNTFAGNEISIFLSQGDSNEIFDNLVTASEYGIYLDYAADSTVIARNSLSNNSVAVLCLAGSRETIISQNTVSDNNEGINLSYSKDVNIVSNILTNNSHAILGYYGKENAWLVKNVIGNNGEGINLFSCDHACLFSNSITKNQGTGLSLQDCDDADILANTIKDNTGDGIHLQSDNTSAISNIISNNSNGLSIEQSRGNTLATNQLLSNRVSGVSLNHSTNTQIINNRLSKNNRGIMLISSFNNAILDNTFWLNRRHAFFEDCTNSWQGNYWGRPRLLPKMVFGTNTTGTAGSSILVDVDQHPALLPPY